MAGPRATREPGEKEDTAWGSDRLAPRNDRLAEALPPGVRAAMTAGALTGASPWSAEGPLGAPGVFHIGAALGLLCWCTRDVPPLASPAGP